MKVVNQTQAPYSGGMVQSKHDTKVNVVQKDLFNQELFMQNFKQIIILIYKTKNTYTISI